MARVLVTGANGFIGTHLVKLLVERGYDVIAAVRSHDSRVSFGRASKTVAIGDIEQARWDSLLAGVDLVVHLAARVHRGHPSGENEAREYHRVNVLATQRLADAAARAGVKRLVFLSSVYAAVARGHTLYGRSKREAEACLADLAGSRRLRVTVLRPPLVYGPRVKANFLLLLKAVDKGLLLPLGSVKNRRSLVFVGNLTDAIERCLREEGKREAFERFFVADNEAISTPDLIRRLARHLERPARLVPFPARLIRLAAAAVRRREAAEGLTESLVVDTSAIRDALNWSPPFSLEQGLAETARWYREAYAKR